MMKRVGGSVADSHQVPNPSIQWDSLHARRLQSRTLQRIYRTAYGADYFDDAAPNSFFYGTLSDLRAIARELRVGPEHTVVDLGCGSGAPTVWVARETGAHLTGIDISEVGLGQARRRAAEWSLEQQVQFLTADLRATGLDSADYGGAMSLDVIDTVLRVEDRLAALREAARLLRPSARFVLTTWELHAPSQAMQPFRDPVADYRPLLNEAGFDVESYEETPDWEARDRTVIEGMIEAEAELIRELGPEATNGMLRYARGSLAELQDRRRVFIVARRA
jgi:SAM-dependent methyltransferase